MKKDAIIILALIIVAAAVVCFTDIQSVDEYYLEHLEDITPESKTVTLSIRCNTIFDNYDQLDASLRSDEYVPADGVILAPTEYVLREGDSVFDILSRAVRHNKIQIDYSGENENSYGAVYVKGIHYIYEFSCGPLSGWIYRVDGEQPSYGCSKYYPEDGQNIEWIYSCALGLDAGDVWKKGEALK